MMKLFLIFLLSITFCYKGFSQDNYPDAMQQAKQSLHDSDYPAAIKLYNAAKAFEPAQSAVVDKKINAAFDLILQQKIEAIKNRDAALLERKRADGLKDIAEANLALANNALKISHANQIMYEAQGVVKLDPTLAMHLAAAALDSIKSSTMDDASKDDSILIADKANRIYYENNFGETVISDKNKPDSLGKFTNVIYSPDNNFIWTITDKLYAVKWNKESISTIIKLDSAYKEYTFKQAGKDSLLLYGTDRGTSTRKKSIKVYVITNKNPPFQVYTNSIDNALISSVSDSIWLNANHDQSEGWAKRLFVFDDQVFRFNGDGKMDLINVVRGDMKHVAFSPDGKLIAMSNSKRGLKIFDIDGKLLNSNINIGDTASDLKFSPDSKMLLVKQSNSLQFFQVSDLRYYSTLYFAGSFLQSYQLSSDADGRWLLVSILSGNQQVINLYKKNALQFDLYAQFKCPGSPKTSAVFSTGSKEILSSSDKIRIWNVPTKRTEPRIIETNSEVVSSVQYIADNTFTCVTFNGKTLRYTYSIYGNTAKMDSAFSNQPPGSSATRLVAFLPTQRALVISEDGQLQLYSFKDAPLEEFLDKRNGFHFDKFTEDQKKRYGITN